MDEKPTNFYANAVNLLGSVYDITMVFRSQSPQLDVMGQPIIIKEKPALSIADEITVRMSPQHAKSVAALLVQQIVSYEKQFGIKLPLPPDMQGVWNDYLK